MESAGHFNPNQLITNMKKNLSPRLTSLLVLAGIAALCAGVRIAKAADTVTAKSLEGTWAGTRFDSGKGEDPAKGVKLQLVFKGNQVKGLRLPQGDIGDGTFSLSADGKTIDAVGSSAGYKGNTYLGIIKIEGDTLTWCTTAGRGSTAKNRPTDFAADPAQHTYLIIVKRK